MSKYFRIEHNNQIATITMLHPTMTPDFMLELGEVFSVIGETSEAVVLRSQEKGFSYGLDLKAALPAIGPLIQGEQLADIRAKLHHKIKSWQASFSTVANCPVPVIAAVHGWCVGGGMDLITACDIRLCSNDAIFSIRETKMAIVADLGTLQRLPAIIGQGHARELAYTGNDIDSSRAESIQLVNHVYSSREELWQAAEKLAGNIVSNASLTVRGVKDVMRYSEGKSTQDGLDYVAAWNAAFLASQDLHQALNAFQK